MGEWDITTAEEVQAAIEQKRAALQRSSRGTARALPVVSDDAAWAIAASVDALRRAERFPQTKGSLGAFRKIERACDKLETALTEIDPEILHVLAGSDVEFDAQMLFHRLRAAAREAEAGPRFNDEATTKCVRQWDVVLCRDGDWTWVERLQSLSAILQLATGTAVGERAVEHHIVGAPEWEDWDVQILIDRGFGHRIRVLRALPAVSFKN